MARKRTIQRHPSDHRNYYVVDANVLAYVALPKVTKRAKVTISDPKERDRANRCAQWWSIIKDQIKNDEARVYVPDICIAESFKVLAKWYYRKHFFPDSQSYNNANRKLRKFVSMSHKDMSKANRVINVHDLATSRDIIISVDRFFEPLYKGKGDVSIADLILLASAKYLIDFYDVPRANLYILTCDARLVKLANKVPDFPNAINPTEGRYRARKTFI